MCVCVTETCCCCVWIGMPDVSVYAGDGSWIDIWWRWCVLNLSVSWHSIVITCSLWFETLLLLHHLLLILHLNYRTLLIHFSLDFFKSNWFSLLLLLLLLSLFVYSQATATAVVRPPAYIRLREANCFFHCVISVDVWCADIYIYKRVVLFNHYNQWGGSLFLI